jgi:stage IV sporulation protein FB
MSWSVTIARVAGSEIRIHLTFLILLAWIGISAYLSGGTAAAVDSVLFIIAVFACVVLHELGHALAALRYGISTPDITLLPIGGLARLSRMPEKPSEEIVIALAGPAVNVVIALVIILFVGVSFDPAALEALASTEPGFFTRLAAVNIFLVIFNLIPAFPMDGGRVLRAVLAIFLGRRRATSIAAVIGQGVAFLFGFLGLMSGNAILVFIAIFVYLAAGAEAGQSNLMEMARRLRITDAMVTSFEALKPDETLSAAADALVRTTQREFPIVEADGRIAGVLTRDALVKGLKATGPDTEIGTAMTKDVPAAHATQRLDTAIRLMQERQAPIVAVTGTDGRLVGYVSLENITELLMLDEARLAGERGTGGPSRAGPWAGPAA